MGAMEIHSNPWIPLKFGRSIEIRANHGKLTIVIDSIGNPFDSLANPLKIQGFNGCMYVFFFIMIVILRWISKDARMNLRWVHVLRNPQCSMVAFSYFQKELFFVFPVA